MTNINRSCTRKWSLVDNDEIKQTSENLIHHGCVTADTKLDLVNYLCGENFIQFARPMKFDYIIYLKCAIKCF